MKHKILLDKRRAMPDNTYPLKIRHNIGTKTKERSLGIHLKEEDWDDKNQLVLPSNANHKIYNAKLTITKGELEKQWLMGIEPASKKVKPIAIKQHSIINYGKKLSADYLKTDNKHAVLFNI
jgi:hypothetical protein